MSKVFTIQLKNFTKELTWRRLYHANSRLVYMDGDKQDGYKDLWHGAAGGYKHNHHWDKILMKTIGSFFVMAIKAINKNNMVFNQRAHYIQGKLNVTNIFYWIDFRFADADHWLEYFPPLAKSDLQCMGLKVGQQSIHTIKVDWKISSFM